MRVTLVSQSFLGDPDGFSGVAADDLIGGAEINLYKTAKLLMDNGHEVTVVQEDIGLDKKEYDGIDLRFTEPVSAPGGRLRRFGFNLRWPEQVVEDSYVHLQHEGYAVPHYKKVHSFNQQGISWDHPGWHKLSTRIKQGVTKRMLGNGTYARASDNSFLSFVQSEWTEVRNQVYPIPNGVDTERFTPRDLDPVEAPFKLNIDGTKTLILFPRTLTEYRGSHLFLQSMYELKGRGVESFVALFVGAQREGIGNEIDTLIDKFGLDSHTEFLGHVPHERMHDIYALADIVTIPTYYSEGSSIACIEGMAAGKPLVVTDVGGLKELVYQNETDGGLKVKPESSALANAFERLVTDPELRAEIGEYARERALTYYTEERWESEMRRYFERLFEATEIPTW
jgi:glycosyltransferase involved in cell wall biosynthesis